ncbi:MAG TPA: fumarylacetoacetate hydrolase family protein [Candidatus Sulfotelmatobacter sp.]|nr:fumarylacetoacetate hydrolase family protein [Candidatus Sulfotelmatobacter sp.]
MRLVTFDVPTPVGPVRRIGALVDGHVADLTAATAAYLAQWPFKGDPYALAQTRVPPDMVDFLAGGEQALEMARRALEHLGRLGPEDPRLRGPRGEQLAYPPGAVRLCAPVPRPNSIRDTLSFETHMRNSLKALGWPDIPKVWYEIPIYYKGNPCAVIGPDETIRWPSYTRRLDYELEFGCFIGRAGRDITEQQAHRYIAGYTIFNDVSARDAQKTEMAMLLGPAKGKDFDGSNAMGPCLVTPDEIDPRKLRTVARVNGEVWTDAHSSDMFWTFPRIIEYISRDETLYPGDFIGSGTAGFGCGLEHGKWLKPGDVIELEVQGIGVLRNPVGQPAPRR